MLVRPFHGYWSQFSVLAHYGEPSTRVHHSHFPTLVAVSDCSPAVLVVLFFHAPHPSLPSRRHTLELHVLLPFSL